MRHTAKNWSTCTWALAIAFSVALCGCRTPGATEASSLTKEEEARLSKERQAFADALAHYGQGLVFQYSGDNDSALENYEQALKADPDNNETYMRVAMAYLRKKQPEDAIAIIERLRKRKPDEEQPYLWLAFMQRAGGQIENAMDTYRRLIRLAPDKYSAYMELASMFVRQGEDEQAVTLLKSGIAEAEEKAPLLRLLGELHVRRAALTTDEETGLKERTSAIETFEKVLEYESDDIPVLLQLADLYILNDDVETAIAYFQKAEQLDPEDVRVKKKLALSFAATGKESEAIEVLERLVEKEPTNSRIYGYLGELYEKADQREKAILNYRLATQSDQPDPGSLLHLALLHVEANPEEAIAILEEGLGKLPDDTRISETIAYLYLHEENYEEASRYFARTEEKVLSTDGAFSTPAFYFNYALAVQFSRRPEDSAPLLARAMEEDAGYIDMFIQFVLQSEDEHAVPDAKVALNKLSELSSQLQVIYTYLGLLHTVTENYADAVTAFETAEKEMPEEPTATPEQQATFYFWFGSACERAGDLERADELLRKCIELNPEHAEAYNYIAYMWAEKGERLDESLEMIYTALEKKPDNGAFLDTLGWVLYMQGKHEEALPQLERAAELMPEDPTILEHLGDVLTKLGRTEEALAPWKKSYQLDRDNEALAEKLKAHGVDIETLLAEEPPAQTTDEVEEESAEDTTDL